MTGIGQIMRLLLRMPLMFEPPNALRVVLLRNRKYFGRSCSGKGRSLSNKKPSRHSQLRLMTVDPTGIGFISILGQLVQETIAMKATLAMNRRWRSGDRSFARRS